MNFYLSSNGQTLGPYSTEQIEIFLKQGLVTAEDQVWAESWPSWLPIGNVPGIAFQPDIQPQTSSPPDSEPPIPGKGYVSNPAVPQSSGLLGRIAVLVIGLLICFVVLNFIKSSGSPGDAIISVLKQNAVLQNNYNTDKNRIKITSESDIDILAERTKAYASGLNAINTSGCPSDFRDAFSDYANKVANFADTLSQHPHVTTDGESALAVLVIAAIGEQGGDEGLNQAGEAVADENNTDTAYVQECVQRGNEVKEAAVKVDSIATKYGVRIQNG
jgi:hypothetical protein